MPTALMGEQPASDPESRWRAVWFGGLIRIQYQYDSNALMGEKSSHANNGSNGTDGKSYPAKRRSNDRMWRIFAISLAFASVSIFNLNRHTFLLRSFLTDPLPGDQSVLDDAGGLSSQPTKLRYYIYNSTRLHNFLRPAGSPELEKLESMERTFHEAVWSIYQALANHPLRTYDPNEAAFFIPPVFPNQVGAYEKYWDAGRRNFFTALDLVTSSSIYQNTVGARHIFIALDGQFFTWRAGAKLPQAIKEYNPDWLRHIIPLGNTSKWFEDMPCPYDQWIVDVEDGGCFPSGNVFRNAIVARDRDLWELYRMHKDENDYREWNKLLYFEEPMTLFGFSIGFLGGPSEAELIPATYEKYSASTWLYFYHNREDDYVYNSTIFRHAPVKNIPAPGTAEARTYSRSSVGFDIDPAEWKRRFADSKFCLVVRGDNPGSRALLRAIRVGCLPVVASNLYPRYAPSLKHTLDMSEYTILIDEEALLADPWGTLHRLYYSLTEAEVKRKMRNLSYAQRVVFPDHPDSLFVPAFVKEAWESLPEAKREVGCGHCGGYSEVSEGYFSELHRVEDAMIRYKRQKGIKRSKPQGKIARERARARREAFKKEIAGKQ